MAKGKQNRCGYKDGKKPPCPKAPLTGQPHCALHLSVAPTKEIATEQQLLGGRKEAQAVKAALASVVGTGREDRGMEQTEQQAPAVSPIAAAQAAALSAATGREEKRAAKPVAKAKPAGPPPTPAQEATENAIRILTAEKLAQQQQLAERQRRKKVAAVEHRTPLSVTDQLPADLDPFDMVDPDGTPWGTPGRYKRWVKFKSGDPQDRSETDVYVNQFRRLGGKHILDEKGQPRRAPHGYAMEIDTKLWGQNILRKAPTGCFDHEVQLENLEAYLDQENSKKGYKGAELVVTETHGSTAVD